jgi:very-short-patch-repair endonuclease
MSLQKVDHEQACEKRKQTMFNKYGVEFNSQREDIKILLGAHCSTDEFKSRARQRGYEQYNHIDRKLWCSEKLSTMNRTMNTVEIAEQIGASPSYVQKKLAEGGYAVILHNHSQQEKMIRSLLDQHQIVYESNTRSIIPPLELDIFIPSKNLAIEVNGIYWHSELQGKDRHYHLNKTLRCEEQGIRLLQFWDVEVEQKLDLVESMILACCGIHQHKLGARQCQLQEINTQEEKQFLEENHIQDYTPSSLCLGLIFDSKLQSCMSFKKSRFNQDFDWELLRFCSRKFTQIIGGASRLFSNRPSGSCISYANRRYSQGSIYQQLGFEFLHCSSPSYYYTKNFNVLESRIKYQKHKLPKLLESFDQTLSEWENMKMNGYDRVWDCGTLVYKKHQKAPEGA